MSEKKKSGGDSFLREERDKFVAFSFAGAHLLVEVTSAGKVVFSSGASCGLCKNGAEKLIGKSFKDMVIKDDHGYVGELFGRLKKSGRIEQARLRMLSHSNKTIYALMGLIGGTTPLVAAYLVSRTHEDLAPAFYLMAAAAVSLAFVLSMKDNSKAPLK